MRSLNALPTEGPPELSEQSFTLTDPCCTILVVGVSTPGMCDLKLELLKSCSWLGSSSSFFLLLNRGVLDLRMHNDWGGRFMSNPD